MATSTTRPDRMGETSQAGLRRMKRLAADARSLSGMPQGIIHPKTGLLIYHGEPHALGHLIAPLDGSSAPRQLPTPPLLGVSSHITTSPDGRWIVLFHPSANTLPPSAGGLAYPSGGTLAIYSQQILSPFSSSSNTIPHSTLPLPSAPLAIIALYPPRQHTTSGLAPLAGPRPPSCHDSTRGPVLLVLVSDGILLIHPQQTPTGEWGMNVLKSPLHTRTHVSTGDQIPISGTSAGEVKRGWMGVVEGDTGVWVAQDKGDRVDVTRVDVGTEDKGKWALMSTPMPPVPELLPPSTQTRQLQGVVFVRSSETLVGQVKEEGADSIEADERVAMVIFTQEFNEVSASRARIDVFGFERREVQISQAFAELSGHNETPTSWDWLTLPDTLFTSIAPDGTTLLALEALSAPGDEPAAMALLSTPRGVALSRMSLTSPSGEDGEGWSVLSGKPTELGELEVDQLILSPSASRGGVGFVCSYGGDGIKLLISPTGNDTSSTDPAVLDADLVAKAAIDVVLAIKAGQSYTDVIQASFAVTSLDAKRELGDALAAKTFELLKVEKGLDRIMRVRQIQVACFGLYDEQRRDCAAEMLRLQEASTILGASASTKDGAIVFDLEQVWRLVFVVEWVYAVLSRIFKESISERGRIDWGIERPVNLDMMYIINPIPRKLLLTLLAQLNAFMIFISGLNRPILPPESVRPGQNIPLNRDLGATLLAKDRIAGLRLKTGVELVKWAKAIVEIHRNNPTPSDEDTQSYLRLQISQQAEEVRKILGNLPDHSALFTADPPTSDTFDAITFQPLPRPIGAQCGRCGWRTLSVMTQPQVNRMGGEQGVDLWREERRGVCGCGGAWGR